MEGVIVSLSKPTGLPIAETIRYVKVGIQPRVSSDDSVHFTYLIDRKMVAGLGVGDYIEISIQKK